MQGNVVSVERTIAAPAAHIFELLADAAKHELIDGSGTVKGTEGDADSEPLHQGSTFGMTMKAGVPYRMVNKVVEFEPDRRIAWQTRTGPLGLIGGRIWRYELSPVEDGTLVRETWDVSQDRQRPMLKVGAMPKQAEDGMRATLERIAAILEP